jgi:DNA-binding GntR family transcriptional regulator
MSQSETPASNDLVTQAYRTLRELIASGNLAPGTRIIETELADRLGVSRTPLRSALHRLRQEGWVTGTADGGKHLRLSVSSTTEADARELYEIIAALEGLAARWAASLPAKRRIQLADDLGAANEAMRLEASRPNPDPQRVFEHHSAFHLQLVEGVSAPRLLTLHAAIKPQSDRYRRIYGSALIPVAAEAAAEQNAVVASIRAGDSADAERLARANWTNAAERMCTIIRRVGDRGSW